MFTLLHFTSRPHCLDCRYGIVIGRRGLSTTGNATHQSFSGRQETKLTFTFNLFVHPKQLSPSANMSSMMRSLSRCFLSAEAVGERGSGKGKSGDRDVLLEREARRRSREIDAMLERERRATKRLVKILLLGAGESGKSTFLKQMRIINGQEFDRRALLDFRDTIYDNILKVIVTNHVGMSHLRELEAVKNQPQQSGCFRILINRS